MIAARVPPRLRRALAAALFLLPAGASPAFAQARIEVIEEPNGAAVGVAVVATSPLGRGLVDEPGLLRLGAQALIEELRPALDLLESTAALRCDRTTLAFTIAAPPAHWAAAAHLLLETIGRPEFGDAALERARGELARILAMEEASPAYDVYRALDSAMFGADARLADPPCGTSERIANASAADMRRVTRTRLSLARLAIGVAGPVDAAEARRLLTSAGRAVRASASFPSPTREPGNRAVWTRQSTVTSWVVVAFPFGESDRRNTRGSGSRRWTGLDEEAIRLVGHDLLESARPSAANAGVYDVAVEVERHGAGGRLVVSLIVAPELASRWTARLERAVEALRAEPLPERSFDNARRRYRGARLLSLATPEARALEAARQLLFDGEYRSPADRIDALTPEQVLRAASLLDRPFVSVVSPE